MVGLGDTHSVLFPSTSSMMNDDPCPNSPLNKAPRKPVFGQVTSDQSGAPYLSHKAMKEVRFSSPPRSVFLVHTELETFLQCLPVSPREWPGRLIWLYQSRKTSQITTPSGKVRNIDLYTHWLGDSLLKKKKYIYIYGSWVKARIPVHPGRCDLL